MGDMFDFFSSLAGGIKSAIMDGQFTDLIQVGIQAASALFNVAKDQYNESWLMKVLVIDSQSVIDEASLLKVIEIIYKEDGKK